MACEERKSEGEMGEETSDHSPFLSVFLTHNNVPLEQSFCFVSHNLNLRPEKGYTVLGFLILGGEKCVIIVMLSRKGNLTIELRSS